MTNSESTVWQRSPHVAFVDDGVRVVLLQLTRLPAAQPQLLLGPAAAIWRALEIKRSLAEIYSLVAQGFVYNERGFQDDVGRFVSHLATEGFLLSSSADPD